MTGSPPAATTATSASPTATAGPSPASTPTAACACTDAPATGRCPPTYVREHVELAYATTVHGAQGETVDHAHLLVGETTGAAAAYVGMTRGRQRNTAHLVADTVDDARAQWIEVFSRDRADLGPGHARRRRAKDDIERYGPQAPAPSTVMQRAALPRARQRLHRGRSCGLRPNRQRGSQASVAEYSLRRASGLR